jgi:AcrR family transcriptional regulator
VTTIPLAAVPDDRSTPSVDRQAGRRPGQVGSPPPRQTGRSPGRPRDKRATSAITDAALRQLADVGYAKISMESVATEAGVARATVYRRYRDKADLVTAAIATNSTTHLSTGPSPDPRADLIAYLNEFDGHFAESCLEVVGTLIGAREERSSLDLHRQRVVEPRMGHALDLLAQARQLGQLRPDADIDLALQMLAGSVFARRMAGVASTPGWAERAVDMVWVGMSGTVGGAGGAGQRQTPTGSDATPN